MNTLVMLTLGGVILAIVFIRVMAKNQASSSQASKSDAETYRVLYESMVSVAMADESLADSEITRIARLIYQLATVQISETTIRETATRFESPDIDFIANLEAYAGSLGDEIREITIRGCVLVSEADGQVDQRELDQIMAIARTLEIPKSRAEELIQHQLGNL